MTKKCFRGCGNSPPKEKEPLVLIMAAAPRRHDVWAGMNFRGCKNCPGEFHLWPMVFEVCELERIVGYIKGQKFLNCMLVIQPYKAAKIHY